MADPTGNYTGSASGRGSDNLDARFQDLKQSAASVAENLAHKADHAADAVSSSDAGGAARETAANLRDQAAQTASEAKGAAKSIAEQARVRLNEILDQQKVAGADKIADVAKAAQSAATDLDKSNPQMARLVRSAADSVDRVAADIRSGDIGTLFDTLSNFGRQQPVAFFGGAVLAGVLLARFFKSDAASSRASGYRQVDPV